MDQILQEVRDFADAAHGEQMRKYTPERYIVHPVRVMELCAEYTDRKSILAAALLHDVLEDTSTTSREITDFLQTLMSSNEIQHTVKLVQELTDEYEKKNYPHWNRKKRKEMEAQRMSKVSADAQTIKYADILDNCREIVQHDQGFGPLFLRECKVLLQKMNKGNPDLKKRASEMVEDGLAGVGKNRR